MKETARCCTWLSRAHWLWHFSLSCSNSSITDSLGGPQSKELYSVAVMSLRPTSRLSTRSAGRASYTGGPPVSSLGA